MDNYPFTEIESKWRETWEQAGTNRVDLDDLKQKYYALVMFSYPSEKKLHIGHWWNYGPTDTFSRFKRMNGYNVFEPMGFDAFGLPAENFAIKHGVHPASTTSNSVKLIREQLKLIGAMYDWDREVNTSDPNYYQWTQWLFLQLFKAGAAYRKKGPINWCPQCLTVLANEQVHSDGSCDRCSSIVETRDLEQWYLKITDFADDLINGLDDLDWPESTKSMQRHWIGRSEGTEIEFALVGSDDKIHAFTTRADTLFGVTYVVLAPEHALTRIITQPDRQSQVEQYIKESRSKTDIERQATDLEKSGVFTGSYALNPATGQQIPVWIADYVLASYGTGAVMAVPAHDQRDYEFAINHDLPLKCVIKSATETFHPDTMDCAFAEYGMMYNSERFDGLDSKQGAEAVTAWLDQEGQGRAKVSYRLRDWSISRQRYWGAPIPIIYCPECGAVPVPEHDLPVLLPEEIDDFTPRGSSPLGAIDSFIQTKCPQCGASGRRDPDTLDTFVDSSWYFLRYTSTDFDRCAFDRNRADAWLPVDTYVGGPEHATGHLIYARYITKFLHSKGLLSFSEPFKRLVHQGIITYQGLRMSKSKGNVVNPDSFVETYGADCFRLYLMFMGDYIVGGDWSDEGIVGIRRFQNRIWRLVNHWQELSESDRTCDLKIDPEINRILHHTVKEITSNLEIFQFNTAISRMMELVNALYLYIPDEKRFCGSYFFKVIKELCLLLAPFAPHMGEELWQRLEQKSTIFEQPWPQWDEKALQTKTVKVAIQVNGKLISALELPVDCAESEAIAEAKALEKVSSRIAKGSVLKIIYVRNKILNFVVR